MINNRAESEINSSSPSLFSFDDSVVTVKHSMNASSNLIPTINGTKSLSNNDLGEGAALRSMMYCSRFSSCSAQKCPLDPLIDSRSEADWDPRCGMAKATRNRYWESMPEDLRSILPYQGYFRAEYNRMIAARERWESLSQEQRERLKAIGRERLEKSRSKLK